MRFFFFISETEPGSSAFAVPLSPAIARFALDSLAVLFPKRSLLSWY